MATVKEMITDAVTKISKKIHGEIVNNLTSTSTTLPLSAAQGKALKEYIQQTAYPVGSIFIWCDKPLQNQNSTVISPTLDTVDKVTKYFGFGTWIRLDSGVFLKSKTILGGSTLLNGSKTVTLTTANLPSHSHSIPSLSGTTDNKSLTGSVYNMAVQSSGTGIGATGIASGKNTGGDTLGYAEKSKSTTSTYTDYVNIDASHSHTITTTANTTGSAGSGQSFSILPPHYEVFMYQRIA